MTFNMPMGKFGHQGRSSRYKGAASCKSCRMHWLYGKGCIVIKGSIFTIVISNIGVIYANHLYMQITNFVWVIHDQLITTSEAIFAVDIPDLCMKFTSLLTHPNHPHPHPNPNAPPPTNPQPPLGKMAAITDVIFSNTFLLMENFVF